MASTFKTEFPDQALIGTAGWAPFIRTADPQQNTPPPGTFVAAVKVQPTAPTPPTLSELRKFPNSGVQSPSLFQARSEVSNHRVVPEIAPIPTVEPVARVLSSTAVDCFALPALDMSERQLRNSDLLRRNKISAAGLIRPVGDSPKLGSAFQGEGHDVFHFLGAKILGVAKITYNNPGLFPLKSSNFCRLRRTAIGRPSEHRQTEIMRFEDRMNENIEETTNEPEVRGSGTGCSGERMQNGNDCIPAIARATVSAFNFSSNRPRVVAEDEATALSFENFWQRALRPRCQEPTESFSRVGSHGEEIRFAEAQIERQ